MSEKEIEKRLRSLEQQLEQQQSKHYCAFTSSNIAILNAAIMRLENELKEKRESRARSAAGTE